MDYMLLICGDESAAAHADDGCDGWAEEMQRRGVLKGGGGLRAPSSAATVRVRAGDALVTDGPFADTKEQIGGYCLIECADMDEAVAVAAAHPAAAYGTIEVRPIRHPGDPV